MIKLLVKIVAVATVSLLTACAGPGLTIQIGGGQARAQGQHAPQAQTGEQSQNGGCGPRARHIGFTASGGLRCEWLAPQGGAQTRPSRAIPCKSGGTQPTVAACQQQDLQKRRVADEDFCEEESKVVEI